MLGERTATRFITPLREGGSLPGLVEADDLGTYVSKFTGAGQGRKTLVAEVVCAELARRLNLEAAKAIRYGNVSPEEALKFVTLNPARQLGIDKFVGSLEAGKDADLVVWSTSPLSNFTRCEQTWVDGRKYFDRAEDAERRKEVERMKAALIAKVAESGETAAGEGEGATLDDSCCWARCDIFCGIHKHVCNGCLIHNNQSSK